MGNLRSLSMRILGSPPTSLLSCVTWVWEKRLTFSYDFYFNIIQEVFQKRVQLDFHLSCDRVQDKFYKGHDLVYWERKENFTRPESLEREAMLYRKTSTERPVEQDFYWACNTCQPFCDESILIHSLWWTVETAWATLTNELGCLSLGSLDLDCQLFAEVFWVYQYVSNWKSLGSCDIPNVGQWMSLFTWDSE